MSFEHKNNSVTLDKNRMEWISSDHAGKQILKHDIRFELSSHSLSSSLLGHGFPGEEWAKHPWLVKMPLFFSP